MVTRWVRALVALSLVGAGALLHAASWQRWSGACAWGGDEDARACTLRQDHRYDFVLPADPWQPVGNAAQLAGTSLLVVALAMLLLPWVLVGPRPGRVTTAVTWLGALGLAEVALATLLSGLTGEPVRALAPGAVALWLLGPTVALVVLAVRAPGWGRAAAVFLVLGSPFTAGISYAIGSFDANPWWEAIAGDLTAVGGLCLLAHALRRPARQPLPAGDPALAA